MKKKLQITIPEPCHEKWEEMPPVEQGGYCNACSKNVIDFTRFSDKELLEFLSKPQQNLCGRFNNSQLDRTIKLPTPQNKCSFSKAWLYGLSLLTSTAAISLPQTSYAENIVIEQSFLSKDVNDTGGDSTRVIRGTVLDSVTKLGVGFAIIVVKNTKIYTTTDFDGKFELKLPKEYLNKSVDIKLKLVGYKAGEYRLGFDENKISFYLAEMPIEACTVGAIVIPRLTRWQKVKGFFRRLF